MWMDFNDRATGDAAILVVVTQILMTLGLGTSFVSLLNPFVLVQMLIGALFFWVVYSGAVYVVSRFLFDASGQYAIYLRITGFAYPTLLLMVFFAVVLPNAFLALVLGGVWFIVVVSHGLMYTVDMSLQRSVIAALGGYALIVVVQAIFGSIWRF